MPLQIIKLILLFLIPHIKMYLKAFLTIILTLVIIRSEGCQGIKNKENEESINGKEKFRNLTQRNASRA